jgi:hypothetical protein
MSPLLLCSLSDPQQHTSTDSEFHMPHQGVQFAIKVNQISRARLEAREADVRTGGPVLSGKIESLDDFLHALDKELPTRSGSSISFSVSLGWKWPAILLPLDECIQSIIWELSYLPASQVVLQGRSMQETASLLRSIALCQVTTDAVSLFEQSIHPRKHH